MQKELNNTSAIFHYIPSNFFKKIIAWNLESLTQGSSVDMHESYVISGWILHDFESLDVVVVDVDSHQILHKFPSNLARKDVFFKRSVDLKLRSHHVNCGFNFNLIISEKKCLAFKANNELFIFGQFIKNKNTKSKFIEGKGGYLFLDNDTNNSISQWTGEILLSERTISGWDAYFRNIYGLSRMFNFNYGFSIPPSKEEVLGEYFHPYERGSFTAIDQFRENFSGKEIFYHINSLKNKVLAFDQTDTHWTDYGSYIAAKDVINFFATDAEMPKLNFLAEEKIGDLGVKMQPYRSGLTLILEEKENTCIFDNGISNNGSIKIYLNEKSVIKETLIICGDSFGVSLARMLNFVFYRVVYMYKPGAFDQDVFIFEKARYFLGQVNQRFLIGQPDTRNSIFDLAKKKIDSMDSTSRKKLLSHLESSYKKDNLSISFYVERMKKLLH